MALVVKNPPANAGDVRDEGSIPGLGGFPGGGHGNPSANAGDVRDEGSIPRLGGFPGGGHGNPLQYSCLENPMDRGALWGCKELDTTEVTKHAPFS